VPTFVEVSTRAIVLHPTSRVASNLVCPVVATIVPLLCAISLCRFSGQSLWTTPLRHGGELRVPYSGTDELIALSNAEGGTRTLSLERPLCFNLRLIASHTSLSTIGIGIAHISFDNCGNGIVQASLSDGTQMIKDKLLVLPKILKRKAQLG
jgi:hypothetical protein